MNGVAVLTSPYGFDFWPRPRMHFAILLVNASGQMALMGGERLSFTPACVPGENRFFSGGVLYNVDFSPANRVCVVTWLSVHDVWQYNRIIWAGYGGLGAMLGFSICLAFGVVYLRRNGLVQQLRRAIRRRSLYLVYQPLVDMTSRRTVGAEALVRWEEPGRSPISPELFVRLAEQYGLVGELTELVVDRAITEMSSLLRTHPGFSLSINIAASDLIGDALYVQLDRRLRVSGVSPAQVAIELTERSTTDLALVRGAIARLHAMGHPVYIDDFGTGFSSLSYLHELAADVIKIDRVFVRACGTQAITASILPQMLDMAQAFGLAVVVEGVETEAQVRYLQSTGHPMLAQGYLFSRPLSAAELLALMNPSLEKAS
jgi:sensor c-di-GMP phosphodiesterase-like protein